MKVCDYIYWMNDSFLINNDEIKFFVTCHDAGKKLVTIILIA